MPQQFLLSPRLPRNPLPYCSLPRSVTVVKHDSASSPFVFVQNNTPLRSKAPSSGSAFTPRLHPEHSSSSVMASMKKILVLTQLYTFLLLTCGTRTMHRRMAQPAPNSMKDLLAKKHFGCAAFEANVVMQTFLFSQGFESETGSGHRTRSHHGTLDAQCLERESMVCNE